MCAKPQREEDVPPPEPVRTWTAPPPPPPIPFASVSFHNRIAVQIAMMTACIAALLCSAFFILSPVWMPAAGFLAVYLYHRRTGQALTTSAGARMGWITGAFLFGITALLFTISFVSLANSGSFSADLQQQMRRMSGDADSAAQAIKMLQNPAVMATSVIFLLGFLFAVIMSFCAAGGALGAKILNKD